jgi:hypothetical protein
VATTAFPVENQRKDNFGTWQPRHVTDELLTITSGYARLDERPSDGLLAPSTSPPRMFAVDSTQVVYTYELTRTTSHLPGEDEFFVNYQTGIVVFNSLREGEVIRADYFQLGSIISADEVNHLYNRQVHENRAPLVSDDTYELATVWVNDVTGGMWLCVGTESGNALWSPTGNAVTDTNSNGLQTGVQITSDGRIDFYNLGTLSGCFDCNGNLFIYNFDSTGFVKNRANGQLYSEVINYADLRLFPVDPIYFTWDYLGTYINHRVTSGYMHIPADGTVGDIIQWETDGTGVWTHPTTSIDLSPNSDDIVPSQRAVKSYVDSQIASIKFWSRNYRGNGIYEITPLYAQDQVSVSNLKISSFTTAGIVKNASTGILSGGNTLVTDDIDDDFILPTENGGTGILSSPQYGDVLYGNSFGGFDLVNLEDLLDIFAPNVSILGTYAQISVDGSNQSFILSLPQDIDSSSMPEFAGIILSDLGTGMVGSDSGELLNVSLTSVSAQTTISGTYGNVIGTVQDIDTTSSPTFHNLLLTNTSDQTSYLNISSPPDYDRVINMSQDGTRRWEIKCYGRSWDGYHSEGEFDNGDERQGGFSITGFEDDGVTCVNPYNSFSLLMGREENAGLQVVGNLISHGIYCAPTHPDYDKYNIWNSAYLGEVNAISYFVIWGNPTYHVGQGVVGVDSSAFTYSFDATGGYAPNGMVDNGKMRLYYTSFGIGGGLFNGLTTSMVDDEANPITELVPGGMYDIRFKCRFREGCPTGVLNAVRMVNPADITDYSESTTINWSNSTDNWQYFRWTFIPTLADINQVRLWVGRIDGTYGTAGQWVDLDWFEIVYNEVGSVNASSNITCKDYLQVGAAKIYGMDTPPPSGAAPVWGEAGDVVIVPGTGIYMFDGATGRWLRNVAFAAY